MVSVVLNASSIQKSFGKNTALAGVSIKVLKGEILGLLGPNGAGKTTLAKILVGLESPDGGEIEYFGQKVKRLPPILRKFISIVPQDPSFYYGFTARQNIEFFSSLYGANRRVAGQRADSLLKWLKLTRFAERKASFLSGGYKRLLNIACSLVNDPKIIFLDEPTVGLDPKMRQLLWTKINELRNVGKTIILTTHYMDEAEELCDRVALMSQGQISVVDSPEKLIAKYGGKTILILKLNKTVEFPLIAKVKEAMPKTLVRSIQSNIVLPIKQADSTRIIVKLSKIVTEAGYEIKGSQVKAPELEDVFLNLTGIEIKG